jgi:uncharacterized membrane protein
MDTVVETVVFEATLRPNPPMSAAALKIVVGVVATFNLGFGLLFILRGAWPVTPFMGLDVLFLAWALNAARNAGHIFERVSLTRERLLVYRHRPRRASQETALNPYWVRVDMDDPPTRTSPLMLFSHGRGIQIGKFLVPEERLAFAKALRAALRRAREPS